MRKVIVLLVLVFFGIDISAQETFYRDNWNIDGNFKQCNCLSDCDLTEEDENCLPTNEEKRENGIGADVVYIIPEDKIKYEIINSIDFRETEMEAIFDRDKKLDSIGKGLKNVNWFFSKKVAKLNKK